MLVGGLILVPVFIYLLKLDEKSARATSIFCILPMVITTGIFYFNNDLIDWNIAIKCAIGGTIGGYIGSKLLKKLPDTVLKALFAVFISYVSFKFIV